MCGATFARILSATATATALALVWGGGLYAETPTVAWEAPVTVASGAGHRGPWRMNESDFRYVDDATVAINDAGVVAVAWADQARQDLLLQIYEADGAERFDEPVNISRSPDIFSWLPRLIIGPGEGADIYVLWQEIVFSGGSHGGEAFFARSTDGGRSFEQPRNLSNTTAGVGKGRLSEDFWHNGSIDLIMNDTGELYAAWTEYEGTLWFTRSGDGGQSFSPPLRVAGTPSEPTRAPSLAAAEETVWLAWTVGEDAAADIRVAHSRDGGGSFSEPQIVAPGPHHTDAPRLALAGDGTVHLVYSQSLPEPPLRYQVVHSRRAPDEDGFSQPQPISRGHNQRFASIGFPAMALDGEERLYVLWEILPRPDRRPMGLGLTVSADGGDSFAAPMEVPGSLDPELGYSGSQQGLLTRKLAVNREGALAVANSYFKADQHSAVLLWRGRPGGEEER